jgi:AcrR family transcriptional regulator
MGARVDSPGHTTGTKMSAVLEVAINTKRFSQKREAIVSAASALFNERGVSGTTQFDVAAAVGLTKKNSITYYFRKKEDLATACFMRAISVFEGLVSQAAGATGVEARVREVMRLAIQQKGEILAGTHVPVVAFHEIRALPHPQVDEVFKAYTGMFRRFRRLLQDEKTAHWSRDELNARAHLCLSLVYAVSGIVERYEPEGYSLLAERYSDVVLHGLAGRQAQWSSTGAEKDWLPEVPKGDPNSQFLRAATELINEQGYAGASVTRIAERLNLTKGGFYYYNDNKDDLVLQCFEHSAAIIRRALELTVATSGQAWDGLAAFVRGLVRYQLSDNGPLLRSAANSALPDPSQGRRVSLELGRVRERISGVVVSGLIDGSVRPLDPSLAAHVLLLGITSAAELRRWVKGVSEDNAADLFARPLMQGLLAS